MVTGETVGMLGNLFVHNLLEELEKTNPGITQRVIKNTYENLKTHGAGPNQPDLLEAIEPYRVQYGIE